MTSIFLRRFSRSDHSLPEHSRTWPERSIFCSKHQKLDPRNRAVFVHKTNSLRKENYSFFHLRKNINDMSNCSRYPVCPRGSEQGCCAVNDHYRSASSRRWTRCNVDSRLHTQARPIFLKRKSCALSLPQIGDYYNHKSQCLLADRSRGKSKPFKLFLYCA